MANRYYSQFKEKKTSAEGERPPTGKRGPKADWGPEKTANWPGNPGKTGPSRSLGYPLVKGFVAGDYMPGNPGDSKTERKRKAMAHADKPGAGAKARRKHLKNPEEKIETVMSEFKHGTLRSGGSGKKVTSRKQAIAIALSEARQAGARIPKK